MADRSSRPHHSPRRTPTRTERRIIQVRVLRRWGAYRLPIGTAPVDGASGADAVRDGQIAVVGPAHRSGDSPNGAGAGGDLVHIDVKKLGKIPAGGGWRMRGRTVGNRNAHADTSSGIKSKRYHPLRGYHFLHTALDGHSRLAYTELLADERQDTAAGFWTRANAWFISCGILRASST